MNISSEESCIKLIIFDNNKRKKNNDIPGECQNNRAKCYDLVSSLNLFLFDKCMLIDNDKKIRYNG